MGMVVKNNMSAVRTLNTLNSNTSALQKSLQKVSSGMKINSAQDDASGYAISERMRVRIRSLDQANQNSQNDSSLMKTAEGAVGNTVEILRALKEKAINAANDSNTDEDRQTIQKEINQFIDQIDDNALVQFNGKYLVDGSKNNAFYETKSILLNQSLKTDTTSTSALTSLSNRAGDSLSIQTTDHYQVSWVQNGKINFTSGIVGSNTIASILTLTNDDGDIISEVAATTDKGLIAAAKEIEDPNNVPYKEADKLTYESGNTASFKTVIEKVEEANGGTLTADTPYALSQLKEDNGLYMFSDTANGGKWDVYLKNDSTNGYIIEDANGTEIGAVDIYVANATYTVPTNTTDKAISTGDTIADETASAEDTYSDTNTLAGLVFNDSSAPLAISTTPTNVNDASITGFTETVSIDLSTLFGAEDEDGNAITDEDGTTIPKYYYKDTNGDFQSDIVATRTKTWTNTDGSSAAGQAATFASDQITFTTSDGTTLDAAELYEYNPDYVETTGENGLTDAWDKFGKAVYTPDKTQGIAFGAAEADVDHQISGLTISILDQDGNVKKAANAALDQFKQYQRAENETGDMSLNFHIGSEANVAFKVGMGDMRAQALGLKGSDGTRIDVYTKEHANAAINVIENALTKALDQQTTIGAIEARLEYTSTNLTTSSENVQAAESTIRDADMAKEMTNYTKSNVLLQAAQAMLAQANQNSSAVLSLLQ